MTPLSFAARDGRLDAARLLIDAGADVNARRCQRHHAAADGHHQQPHPVAALLLSAARIERRRLVGPHAAVGGGRNAQHGRRQPARSRTASIAAPVLELIEALIARAPTSTRASRSSRRSGAT